MQADIVRNGLLSWESLRLKDVCLLTIHSKINDIGETNVSDFDTTSRVLSTLQSPSEAQARVLLVNLLVEILSDGSVGAAGSTKAREMLADIRALAEKVTTRLCAERRAGEALPADWPFRCLALLNGPYLLRWLRLLLAQEVAASESVTSSDLTVASAELPVETKIYFLLNLLCAEQQPLWLPYTFSMYADSDTEESSEEIFSIFSRLLTIIVQNAYAVESSGNFLQRLVNANNTFTSSKSEWTMLERRFQESGLVDFAMNVLDCSLNVRLHNKISGATLFILTLPQIPAALSTLVWQQFLQLPLLHLVEYDFASMLIYPVVNGLLQNPEKDRSVLSLMVQVLQQVRREEDQILLIVKLSLLRLALFLFTFEIDNTSSLEQANVRITINTAQSAFFKDICSSMTAESIWLVYELIRTAFILSSSPYPFEPKTILFNFFPESSDAQSSPVNVSKQDVWRHVKCSSIFDTLSSTYSEAGQTVATELENFLQIVDSD
jgi:hypothetical protein